MKTSKAMKRANRILEIAFAMAEKVPGWETSNCIAEIQLHPGYAEPGYDDPTCGIVATGNWNDVTKWDKVSGRTIISTLPSRVGDLLEKVGVSIEWSDEWFGCHDCGKLFRTCADSHYWEPSYVVGDAEVKCLKCAKEEE